MTAATEKGARVRAWKERADKRFHEMIVTLAHEWPWPYSVEQLKAIVDALDQNEQDASEVVMAAGWYVAGLETLDKATRAPHRDAQAQLIALDMKCQEARRAAEMLTMQASRALSRRGCEAQKVIDLLAEIEVAADAASADQGRGAKPSPKGGPRPKLAINHLLARLGEIYRKAPGRRDSLPRAGDKRDDSSAEELYDDDVEAHDAALEGYSGPFLKFLRLTITPLPGFERLGDHGLVERYRKAKQTT